MKYIFNKLFLAAAFVSLTFASCDQGLTDLNVDPNEPVSVPAENLLTQAQYALFDELHSRTYNAEWTMLLVQHWSQNEYAEESRYVVTPTTFNLTWSTFYASVLNELEFAKNLVTESETLTEAKRANQLAVLNILQAIAYHSLVDGFGDVPFSEALNAADFPLPAYDGQDEIYMGILERLQTAVNSIDESTGSFDSGDIVYGGDISKWKKLGNSLIMRVAMRMVDVDEAAATPYINSSASGMLESNADNALFIFDSNSSIANPLWIDVVVDTRDDFCVSDVLVDNLTAMGDPRLAMFAATNIDGEYVGMPYGLTDAEATALKSLASRPNDQVRAATAPHVIMDYAEVQFLAAEAFARGILSGDAASAYANGITASMNYWGISDAAAIDAYVAANPYNDANWKESLGWQKWIAFYMNGPQAWAEWRRLDYPELAVPTAAVESSIPVRLPYPLDEQTSNTTNLSRVTDAPNDMSTKLWWDVN